MIYLFAKNKKLCGKIKAINFMIAFFFCSVFLSRYSMWAYASVPF